MHYLVLNNTILNTLIWMHVPESLRLPSHACLHEWRLESQLARYILSSFLFFLDKMIDQAFNWRYLNMNHSKNVLGRSGPEAMLSSNSRSYSTSLRLAFAGMSRSQ